MTTLQTAPARDAGLLSDTTARAGVAAAVVAAVAGLAGGRLVNSDEVDGYGLISALPPLYWTGVVAGLVATGLLLRSVADGNHRLGFAVPATWILLLHTAPQLAHARARFSIVYIHMGFIRIIDETQTGNILVDARFAWPGFFGVFISSLPALSPDVLDWVMRLWPTAVGIVAATLVAALARRSYPTQPLMPSISALVFVLLSWTGQDYFSPQSIGFVFYLAIVMVVEGGPLVARGAWSSMAPILSRFATGGGDRPDARSTASYVSLLLLSFGAVVSHPLAPFFICTGLAMLGLYGRRVAWRLLTLVGLGYVIWFLVAAQPWWSTQVDYLIEQLANISNVLTASEERGATPSAPHASVLQVRTALGLFVFVGTLVLGIVMGTDRFRHLRPALPLAPLAGIPVLAAAVQSYGGEMIIRVFLFTLPMASILMARVLLALPRRVAPILVPAMAAVVVPAFLLARFGNEEFEMVTAADAEAVEVAYANAGPRTLLLADNAFLPWGDRQRDTLDIHYSVAEPTEAWIRSLRADADLEVHVGDHRGFDRFGVEQVRAENIIVVFTPSQSAWLHHVEGVAPDSLDEVGRWMAARPEVEVLYQGDGAWVLELGV